MASSVPAVYAHVHVLSIFPLYKCIRVIVVARVIIEDRGDSQCSREAAREQSVFGGYPSITRRLHEPDLRNAMRMVCSAVFFSNEQRGTLPPALSPRERGNRANGGV